MSYSVTIISHYLPPSCGFNNTLRKLIYECILMSCLYVCTCYTAHKVMDTVKGGCSIYCVDYNRMQSSFYKHHAQAGCIFLLGGVNHTQRRTNKPLSISYCCQGDVVPIMGAVRDALAWRTSRLDYALLSKELSNRLYTTSTQKNGP